MSELLYPIKFTPILKNKIWGGRKLNSLLNKVSDSPNVGESWEISDVKGDISIVSNGHLRGQSLKDLLGTYKENLIGKKNYKIFGERFPLLIKFIDAKENLSIQLHPDNKLAAERHNSFGKTEMWYVMQADTNSNLIVGFNQKITSETYLRHLKEKSLTKILNFDKVTSGDAYFIETGCVHAIGAGVLLAEIQQTSDVTYRIYDWDRVDDKGNSRELHNDLAIDAIDFSMKDNCRVQYSKTKNEFNKMVSCNYFTTNYLDLDSKIEKQNNQDSFLIYMCVAGEAKIHTSNGMETICEGETILLPAALKTFSLSGKNTKLLEVYV
ncbi:mannose-6-phosphate isomerase [Flavobacteriaceae bacterium AU392]|nr:mannose-6-phosphate isomerase [Flavobacteriaceae bacterium]RKM81142.1 mannose-6-phosphate isomerase [Flavobacteriaceae bacterium AU392]